MKIFVAVAWPYANGNLHLGTFAGSLLAPDIFARFHRQKGNEVLMVSGTDMHGTPIEVAAEKAGMEPKEFALGMHKKDVKLMKKLAISFNIYTNTDTKNHETIVKDLFLDLWNKKYLFKQKVKQFWSDKEKKFLLDRYIEGECPYCHYEQARGDQCDECGRTLEPIELINPKSRYGDEKIGLKETENIYLDLPKFEKDLQKWLDENPNVVNWRHQVLASTKAWFAEGLKPRPVTRDLLYGVPIPDEIDLSNKKNKVIYVWIEAVTGYWSSSVEWEKRNRGEISGGDVIYFVSRGQSTKWEDYWKDDKCKHYYFMGKDNIVFHTIIWPALLIGWNKGRKDKLNLPFDVPANAFLNLEGKQMSKSRNWFVELEYLLDNYGNDLLRFYFAIRMPENKDSDFRWKDFIDVNNKELVGNLGNFIHRTLSFISSKFGARVPKGSLENEVKFEITDLLQDTDELMMKVKIAESIQRIMKFVSFANKYFDKKAVWEVYKSDKISCGNILYNCVQIIEALRIVLTPFLPDAMKKLSEILAQNEIIGLVGRNRWRFVSLKPGIRLYDVKPLFAKIDTRVIEKERYKLGK